MQNDTDIHGDGAAKRCRKCQVLKPLVEFSKNRRSADGYASRCKPCESVRSALRYKNNSPQILKDKKNLHRTAEGCINDMFETCKRYRKPKFTKAEFLGWVPTSDFNHVYSVWEKSDHQPRLAPSIVLVDAKGDYTLQNIRISSIRFECDTKKALKRASNSKVCGRCHVSKLKGHFYANSFSSDGYESWCKFCFKALKRAYYEKNHVQILLYKSKFHKTYDGCIKGLYYNMPSRVKKKKRYQRFTVDFSIEEFEKWIPTSTYAQVWKRWKDSGYDRCLSPSVDRINNAKGYSLGNIQILSVSDNASKGDS